MNRHTLFLNFTGHGATVAAALAGLNIPIFWQMTTWGLATETNFNTIRDYQERLRKNKFTDATNLAIILYPPHVPSDPGPKIDKLPPADILKRAGIESVVIFTEDDFTGNPIMLEKTEDYHKSPFYRYIDYLNARGLKIVPIGLDSESDPANRKENPKEILTIPGTGDRAMATEFKRGGIYLTPANKVLQSQDDNMGIKFHTDAAMLQQFKEAPGLTVGSITIKPLKSLSGFFGADSIDQTARK